MGSGRGISLYHPPTNINLNLKDMKAKVRLTDAFSGRSINVITELVNRRWNMYEFSFESLSDFQRKKIEDFFGKENAYHTKVEVINQK